MSRLNSIGSAEPGPSAITAVAQPSVARMATETALANHPTACPSHEANTSVRTRSSLSVSINTGDASGQAA